MMASPNELRVFISSTFRDLQEEREHLVKKIFPEIRSLCRQRGITFTEVDLRWGLTEEEATLGRVIRTCLEEVDKCRPYFIGIIGNRYGWVPELYDILMDPDLLAKYPFVEELAIDGASVTEMEFVHGVFDAPEVDGQYAFFYHRGGDVTDSDYPERLESLIDRVHATGRPYREFTSVEELGEAVRSDLVSMIETNWPDAEAPSELDLERRAHAAFAASRTRAYIPNPAYLKEFTAWLTESETPLVISAESGLGKSSLVAYLVDYYHKKHPSAFIIAHYVGASPSSGTALSVIRHIIEAIRVRFGIDEALPSKPEELQQSFPNWLYRCEHLAAREGIGVLMVIDAVNQLDELGQRMSWLPERIPAGVKLMISATPGESADRLSRRGWSELKVVPLEDERIRQSIVVRYLGEFRKGVSSEQLRQVIADAKARSPLYLRVVAEELRLHGEHETLGEAIAKLVSAPDLETVFQQVLERMEQDHGVERMRQLLRLLWASRAGLSELELLELTSESRLELSRMLFALDYHLNQHDGLLGFFHEYLRRAVEQRYLAQETERRSSHQQLAAYFASLEVSQRSGHELLWQYRQSEDDAAMARYLSRLEVLGVVCNGSGRYEVQEQWAWLRKRGHDASAAYLVSVKAAVTGDATILKSLLLVGRLLQELGEWGGAMEVYEHLLDHSVAAGSAGYQADALGVMGGLLALRGEYDEALRRLERAREIFEDLGDRLGISRAIGTMGQLCRHRGEYDRALKFCEESLRISEDIGDHRGVAQAIGTIGNVCAYRGEYDRALECYEQWLNMSEELGDRSGACVAVGNMGGIYFYRGEYDRALGRLEQSLRISEELGDRGGQCRTIANIGSVYGERGEYDRAMGCLEQSLRISEELGDRPEASRVIGSMGTVYLNCGEYDRALECFERSLAENREMGNRYAVSYVLEGRASLLLEIRGHATMPEYVPTSIPSATSENWRAVVLKQAREDAEQCGAISSELSKSETLFQSQVLLARIEAEEGRLEVALQLLSQMLEDAGEDEQRAALHYWLCKLGARDGDHHAEALGLYCALFEKTPKHTYRQRIEELSSPTEPTASEATDATAE